MIFTCNSPFVGDVRLTQDNVQDVMTAADMIQLKDVVASCTQFMKSELHPSNAVGIYRSFFTVNHWSQFF
jgi:hypothetical protein